MSDARAADPNAVLRLVGGFADVHSSLIPEAVELRSALDHVRRTCIDHGPPVPRRDEDLRDLGRDVEHLARCALVVGLRFLTADRGGLWPWGCEQFEPVYRDLIDHSRRERLPHPLGMLILLAGEQSLTGDDLSDIGGAVLGLGRSTKSLVDLFSPIVAGVTTTRSLTQTQGLADRLAETPAGRRVLGTVELLSGSTLVNAAGAGLTALTLLEDINRLKREGNPWKAWRRKGAGYVADVAGAGFDATSAACARAPSPYTCVPAAVSGTAWVAAEAWKHREGIGLGLSLTHEAVRSEVTRLRGLAGRALRTVGTVRQSFIDTIRNFDRAPGLVRLPRVVTHTVADVVEGAGHLSAKATQGAENVASNGWGWVKRQVTEAVP